MPVEAQRVLEQVHDAVVRDGGVGLGGFRNVELAQVGVIYLLCAGVQNERRGRPPLQMNTKGIKHSLIYGLSTNGLRWGI